MLFKGMSALHYGTYDTYNNFLDKTPGRQSATCVLRARRQKEQGREFER